MRRPIGKMVVITINGRSKVLKIVKIAILLNFFFEIGNVFNQLNISPDMIAIALKIPIRKKSMNWRQKKIAKIRLFMRRVTSNGTVSIST
jgi:hypothetical protein